MDLAPKTLKKLLGDAGAGIDKSNGQDALYDVLKALQDQARNRVMENLVSSAPTTPSSQATGAAGTLAVRVNLALGALLVDGSQKRFAAQADVVLYNAASVILNLSSAQFAIVAKKDPVTGAITIVGAYGSSWVTASGTPVAPTRGQIQAQVGYDAKGNPIHWVLLGNTTVNRTADTTVTQTYDDTPGDFGAQGVVIE